MCGRKKSEGPVRRDAIEVRPRKLRSACCQGSIRRSMRRGKVRMACSRTNSNAILQPELQVQPKRQYAAERQFAAQSPFAAQTPICRLSPNANSQPIASLQPERVSAAQTHVSQHRLCSCSCFAKRIEQNYWGRKVMSVPSHSCSNNYGGRLVGATLLPWPRRSPNLVNRRARAYRGCRRGDWRYIYPTKPAT